MPQGHIAPSTPPPQEPTLHTNRCLRRIVSQIQGSQRFRKSQARSYAVRRSWTSSIISVGFEPVLNVGSAVSDVASKPVPNWSFASVSPRVESALGDAEVVGKVRQRH